MIALLLPVIVCVWFLGWVMYWLGGSKPVKSKPIKIVPMEVQIG